MKIEIAFLQFKMLLFIIGFDVLYCFLESGRLSLTKRSSQEKTSLSLTPRLRSSISIGAISLLVAVHVPFARADTDKLTTFSSTEGHFSFRFSDDLVISPKPVKTHQVEVYLKSQTIPGFSVGLTMDPVRIEKIQDFATPDGLAEKVLAVERGKDGVFDAQKISASEDNIPIVGTMLPVYDIEYKIDSSRGKNRYEIRTAVYNKKLYVLTCQCKDESFPSLSTTTKEILNSFTLTP